MPTSSTVSTAITPINANVRGQDSATITCQISALKNRNSTASVRIGRTRATIGPIVPSSRPTRRADQRSSDPIPA